VPELPDVEGYRRYLARHAQGQKIVHVHVPDHQIVRNRSAQSLGRSLHERRFAAPRRHGKWLIAPLKEGPTLLIHFGMTGHLQWAPDAEHRHPHDRLIFVCEGGELRYNNMRRFGGVWLTREQAELDQVTGRLGPDAASLDRPRFDALLAARRGAIKAALMDQRLVAGLGNLLSDEILWRAHIHPASRVGALSVRQRSSLYQAIGSALSESIPYGRVPLGERWLTGVRDDPDGTCPRCGSGLRHGTVAGRTSCWCPREQRRRH